MTSRFRHLGDKKLVGLYLLLKAVAAGKDGVLLTNSCLCQLFRVQAVHDGRIHDLAWNIAGFLPEYEIRNVPGWPKAASFLLRRAEGGRDLLTVDRLPTMDEMEKELGFSVVTVTIDREY